MRDAVLDPWALEIVLSSWADPSAPSTALSSALEQGTDFGMDGGHTGDVGARELIALYEGHLRAGIFSVNPRVLDEIDRMARGVRAVLEQPPRLRVAFVGEAQAGKSTLINALIGRRMLPAGGTGPLTANKIRVSHGHETLFEATFHPRERVAELLSLLTDAHERERSGERPSADDLVLWDEAFAMLAGGVPDTTDLPRSAILSCLDVVVCGAPGALPGVPGPLRDRIETIRQLLGKLETVRQSELGSARAFRAALDLRASGWLATLISDIDLRLNIESADKLELVDLPGLGTTADAARRLALEHLAHGFDTLVIVVRNSGLTEPVVHALHERGLLASLVRRLRTDPRSCPVVVAATHLDDVARDRCRQLAEIAETDGGSMPEPDRVFQDLAEQMIGKLREQLAEVLHRLPTHEPSGETRSIERDESRALAHHIPVLPVASLDYLQLRTGRPDDSLLRNEATTSIPTLSALLHSLANKAADARERRLRTAAVELQNALVPHLPLLTEIAASRALTVDGLRAWIGLVNGILVDLRLTGADRSRLEALETAQLEAYEWMIVQHGQASLIPAMLLARRRHAETLAAAGNVLEAYLALWETAADYQRLLPLRADEHLASAWLATRVELAHVLHRLGRDDDALDELSGALDAGRSLARGENSDALHEVIARCAQELDTLSEHAREAALDAAATLPFGMAAVATSKYLVQVTLNGDDHRLHSSASERFQRIRAYEVVAADEPQAIELARRRVRAEVAHERVPSPETSWEFRVEQAEWDQELERRIE